MSITHLDGNVIHADFGKPAVLPDFRITINFEILYIDEHIVLTRTTGFIGDKPYLFHTTAERGVSA